MIKAERGPGYSDSRAESEFWYDPAEVRACWPYRDGVMLMFRGDGWSVQIKGRVDDVAKQIANAKVGSTR